MSDAYEKMIQNLKNGEAVLILTHEGQLYASLESPEQLEKANRDPSKLNIAILGHRPGG